MPSRRTVCSLSVSRPRSIRDVKPQPSPHTIEYRMSFSGIIKVMKILDREAQAMARELAQIESVSLTEAVRRALREKLDRVRRTRPKAARPVAERLNEIAARCAGQPDLDRRSPDEIIGYDDRGLPSKSESNALTERG